MKFIFFHFISSPEPKAQVSFSDRLSPFLCLSVRPSVNIPYFRLLLKNHQANFNQIWQNASFREGNSSFFKLKAPPFSKRRWLRNSETTLTKLKKSSSPEPRSQFQPNLAQCILLWREFNFVQMKGPALFQGEIITNSENT